MGVRVPQISRQKARSYLLHHQTAHRPWAVGYRRKREQVVKSRKSLLEEICLLPHPEAKTWPVLVAKKGKVQVDEQCRELKGRKRKR